MSTMPQQFSTGNRAVLRQANPTKSAAVAGTGNTGVQQNATSACAGWNRDPQSLSKRAAEHYMQDKYHLQVPTADSIVCSTDKCVVHYKNGNQPFDVTVYLDLIANNSVQVSTSLPLNGRRAPLCTYTYDCDANNNLRFSSFPLPCL